MRRRRSRRRQLAAYAALGAIALLWFLWLRPTSLGGAASYVIVQGSSMEPTYDSGDLVIVREEAHYDEGDVIAFRVGGRFNDPTRVIHRVVGRNQDGTFITQGDNHDRTDPWKPGQDNVIGRAVLHIPRLGDLAGAGRRPEVLAGLGAAAVMVGGQKRRKRRMSQGHGSGTPSSGAPLGPSVPSSAARAEGSTSPRWRRHTEPRWAFTGLITSAVLLVPVLLVAWSAIRAADSAVRIERLDAVELGVDLDYRFVGDPSPVYPDGTVGTTTNAVGAKVATDPLFSRLLTRLEVALTFTAAGSGDEELVGTYAVDVSVRMPEGWTSSLASIGATPFTETAQQVVAIDLADAAARVAQVAELTGVGGNEFTVMVIPRIDVDATAGGEPVREVLAPETAFVVKSGVITAQPILPTNRSHPVERQVRERLDYGLGPFSLSTQSARGILGGLALVLFAAVAVCAGVLFGGIGLRESDRIAARYRSQIVDVAAATGPPGPVVLVGAIEELVRLAKVEQSVILHEDLGDGCHRYRVFLGAVTYEYETAPEHGGRAAEQVPGSGDSSGGS